MTYPNLRNFVDTNTKGPHGPREDFLNHPLCVMQAMGFSADERLILCTMDRAFIKAKLGSSAPPELDTFQVESNWPALGDFDEDPFQQQPLPNDDCHDTNAAAPPRVGGGPVSPVSPIDADPTGPAALAAPFAEAAGQAWGDPEPHIVNIRPEDGYVGDTLMVVGEGILPEAKIYLCDANGIETPLDPVSGNPPVQDYYAASFRRTYIRGKIPNGLVAGQLYTVHVRNAVPGPVLEKEHFIGYGPSFKVL